MAFDSVKSTFGEYLSGKVEIKSKFIANNISILRKHEFNEELLNTAIYKAVFHYKNIEKLLSVQACKQTFSLLSETLKIENA